MMPDHLEVARMVGHARGSVVAGAILHATRGYPEGWAGGVIREARRMYTRAEQWIPKTDRLAISLSILTGEQHGH